MKRFVIDFKKVEGKSVSTLNKFYKRVGFFSYLEKRGLKISISDVCANRRTINKIRKVIEDTWCKFDISLDGEVVYGRRKRAYRDLDELVKHDPYFKKVVSSLEMMFLSLLPKEDNTLKDNELVLFNSK